MASHDTPPGGLPITGLAWARYKRLMRFMALFSTLVIMISWILLYRELGFVSIHFYVASGLGIGISMLLMSALMGLVFLSNASGHDQAASELPKVSDDQPSGG